jgi:predicted enzyme related to lactoylglutathione lyase
MKFTSVVVRRRVANLDDALPFYERLTGERAHRFSFGGADLAAVGPFLLFVADGDAGDRLERVVATLAVEDLDAAEATLIESQAQVVAPLAQTPNGRRVIVRHPDGAVFEYVGR